MILQPVYYIQAEASFIFFGMIKGRSLLFSFEFVQIQIRCCWRYISELDCRSALDEVNVRTFGITEHYYTLFSLLPSFRNISTELFAYYFTQFAY